MRDERIRWVYEGTDGIQQRDVIARKLLGDDTRAVFLVFSAFTGADRVVSAGIGRASFLLSAGYAKLSNEGEMAGFVYCRFK